MYKLKHKCVVVLKKTHTHTQMTRKREAKRTGVIVCVGGDSYDASPSELIRDEGMKPMKRVT